MFGRVIIVKVDYCGDEANSICGLWVAAMKIMFGQLTDHSIPTEQKRKRFNNCSLPAVIWTD